MKLFNYLLIGLLPLGLAACNGNEPNGNGENGGEGGTTPTVSRTYNNVKGLVPDCADPYVLYHDGQYYLYGTGGDDGIKVYISTNLANSIVFAVLIVVLLVKPSGLLGKYVPEKV